MPANPVGVGGHDDGCGKGSVDDDRTGAALGAAAAPVAAPALGSSSFSLGAGLGVVDEAALPPDDDVEPDADDEAEPRRVLVQSRTLR